MGPTVELRRNGRPSSVIQTPKEPTWPWTTHEFCISSHSLSRLRFNIVGKGTNGFSHAPHLLVVGWITQDTRGVICAMRPCPLSAFGCVGALPLASWPLISRSEPPNWRISWWTASVKLSSGHTLCNLDRDRRMRTASVIHLKTDAP